MKNYLPAIAAFVCLSLGAHSAQASLTYVFHQTSGSPASLNVAIQYTIADESGAALSYSGSSQVLTGSFDNLLDFSFSGGGVNVDLNSLHSVMSFCTRFPPSVLCEVVRFQFVFGLGEASLFYLTSDQDFGFNSHFWPNRIGHDNARFLCFQQCTFDGEFVLVPEPATLTLLSVGLLSLFYFRRKRAAPR